MEVHTFHTCHQSAGGANGLPALGPSFCLGTGADPFVPGAQRRRGDRRTDHDAYRIRTQSLASIGHRPGVRHRVDNRLGVRRLLRDFIEKTAGTERPCTDDGQCPRTDDNHRPRTNDT